jgi:hypothetical protein
LGASPSGSFAGPARYRRPAPLRPSARLAPSAARPPFRFRRVGVRGNLRCDNLGLELQPELHRGVEEALDRGIGDDKLLEDVVEGELDRELRLAHLQVPELVLQDNRDLFGIFLPQAVRYLDLRMAGVERDEQVMFAR